MSYSDNTSVSLPRCRRRLGRTLWAAPPLLLFLLLVSDSALAAPPPDTLAFKNVNVITMDPDRRKQLEKGWTVVVEDGVITAADKTGKFEIPADATPVNGRRKMYLLPGLWDMHAHGDGVLDLPERFGPQDLYTYYLANGITEEKFRRLHEVARKLGVPVVGHALRPGFPIQATLEEEQRMLTHIEEILSTSVSNQGRCCPAPR